MNVNVNWFEQYKLAEPFPSSDAQTKLLSETLAKVNISDPGAVKDATRQVEAQFTSAHILSERFGAIKKSPFLSKSIPPQPSLKLGQLKFSKARFSEACLNAGYGLVLEKRNYKFLIKLDMAERNAFDKHWHLRAELVCSCLKFGTSSVKARTFIGALEASDKVPCSFSIGSASTYLTCEAWLAAGGRKIKSFLNYSLFTAATNIVENAAADAGKSRPDFLVIDDKDDFHLFESKGGQANGRPDALLAGLKQLLTVSTLSHGPGQCPHPPLSTVCIHASVDAGESLEIFAYDPPGDGVGGHGGELSAPASANIELVPGVAPVMRFLESFDLFQCLQVNGAVSNEAIFNGLLVTKAKGMDKWARRTRFRLMTYLRLKAVLETSVEQLGPNGWREISQLRDVFDRDGRTRMAGPVGQYREKQWERLAVAVRTAERVGDVMPQIAKLLALVEAQKEAEAIVSKNLTILLGEGSGNEAGYHANDGGLIFPNRDRIASVQ